MFGLSLGHLIILLVIVVLIRARYIPETIRGLGKTVTLFKRGLRGESLEETPPRRETLGVREADDILPPEGKSKKS